MAEQWTFPTTMLRMGGAGANRISAEDGARQEETALSILQSLSTQPGIVLADEVGMGKTYVALAVVASAMLANRRSGRPIVVMVPPTLAQKWPRDWDQFQSVCCAEPSLLDWVRDKYVHTPTEFFRAMETLRSERPHIIWMTTRCFSRGLSDPWTKLALIRLARSRTRMDDETKKTLAKWATTLVRLKSKRQLTPELIEMLLHADIATWRALLVREQILSETDGDPVSKYLLRHQHEIDWAPLITVLRGDAIPGRRGAVSDQRLQQARDEFNQACQKVYWNWLASVNWRAPLLVLDEAHHAKNDGTGLADLLRSEEPLLRDKFDRMLFLTATPFQLGHHELISVLRSFGAAKWTGPNAPIRTRGEFLDEVKELESRLNRNRHATRRLDKLWGKLAHEAVRPHLREDDPASAAIRWWRAMQAGTSSDAVDRELMAAIEECRRTKALAENDPEKPWSSLRTWVVRHNRSGYLPGRASEAPVARRLVRTGKTIADEGKEAGTSGDYVTGLPISGDAALPFLLCARAQGELAYGSIKGRAFFAEGLCSSYEAFHHTREMRGDSRDTSDDGIERNITALVQDAKASLVPVSWYEDQVARMIPSKRADDVLRFGHPKVQAVVRRTISLWLSGEKVLLFCFYRETAKALRAHIGREVENATMALAARKLGLPADRAGQVRNILDGVARRLSDQDSPFHRGLIGVLREPLASAEFAVLRPHQEALIGLLTGYVRSPSFIARYVPLDIPEVREALVEGSKLVSVARAGAEALARAIANDTDASALKMAEKIQEFLRFSKELAEQRVASNEAEDESVRNPLQDYLDAVGVYVAQRRSNLDDDSAPGVSAGAYRVLQPVRMVFGDTKTDARQRLMLAFNSPMFPEILISSAVLGEGVDLHRFCRHVIHHDLCWNPSTLEQRTGRLDRIRCKAETARRPIVVYEPYLGGSADEKMFRVVQDRERWFQIVMGQKFEFDEATSEELANRIPLPTNLATSLVFDLARYRSIQSHDRD